MVRASIATLLIPLLLFPLRQAAAQQPNLSAHAQDVRTSVNNLAIGGKMTVKMLDGSELHGNLSRIDSDAFSIREVDQRRLIDVRYDDVDRVSKDYGRKGIGGKRVNPHRAMLIGIVFIGALLALVFAAVLSDHS